jgi:5-hydroxyisourate hydrolase-like protein (transthyretin family)
MARAKRRPSAALAVWAVALLAAVWAIAPAGAGATMTSTPSSGQISGKVTDAASHAGLAQVEVEVYSSNDQYVGSSITGPDGTYTVASLPAGSYVVEFYPESGAEVWQYYNNASSFDRATRITVSAGANTTGVDAALQPAGTVAGKVTEAVTGAPLAHVWVAAYDASGNQVRGAETAGSGEYSIGQLGVGTYRIGFFPGGVQPWSSQYYRAHAQLADATTVTVTGGATTAGVDAQLGTQSIIQGTVTDAATHASEPGVEVDVYDGSGTYVTSDFTRDDGTYAVGGLGAGAFRLHFVSSDADASQYYSGRSTLSTADAVTTTAGHATTSSAALVAGARIQGAITDATTHQPLSGVAVNVLDADGTQAGWGATDDTGRYTVSGLPAGTYRVEFAPGDNRHAFSYYNGRQTLASADPVRVTAASTVTGIDAGLGLGGAISGTATDSALHAPAAGVQVYALGADQSIVGWATTGADGSYQLGGLAAGSYRVEFTTNYDTGVTYDDTYYPGGSTFAAGTAVAVRLGQTTAGIDQALQGGARVTGTVTDQQTHRPLAGIAVSAGSIYAAGAHQAVTAADGTYAIGGLPPGPYEVSFSAPDGAHASQYYSGATSYQGATQVTLTTGTTTTGIDAALAPGGQVTGTVTDAATHGAVAGARVTVFDQNDAVLTSVTTAADGTYAVIGLPAGTLRVGFAAPSGSDDQPQFDGGAATLDAAPGLTLAAGGALHSTDAALAAGTAISGTVTSAGGGALSEAQVLLYDASGSYLQSTSTGDDGTYAFHGLGAATYHVAFSAAGRLGQFYSGAQSLSTATDVKPSARHPAQHVDAQLADGGAVSGTVVDAALGSPLGDVPVTAYDATSGAVVGTTTTDRVGRYTIAGLASGQLRIGFAGGYTGFGSPAMYVSAYYPAAATLTAGTTVAVTAGRTTTRIDGALQRAGDIEGTVTNAVTHAPAKGVTVNAYNSAGTVVDSEITGADGTYGIPSLPAGQYRLSYSAAAFTSSYYGGATSLSSATPVTVSVAHRSTGTDVALQPLGSITGTVTDAQAGTPVGGIVVIASQTSGNYTYTTTVTDGSGHYEIDGLTTGSYHVYAESPYSSSSSAGAAYAPRTYLPDPVSVTTGSATPGIDFALARAAHVSGTVLDATTHQPVAGVTVEAIPTSTPGDGSIAFSSEAQTASDGTYTIGGLAAGTYRVEFAAPSYDGTTTNYLTSYYNGKSYTNADPLTLVVGETRTGIDAALVAGGEIDGRITDASTSSALNDAAVTVYDASGNYVSTAYTSSDGTYAVHALPAGQYRLSFSGPYSSSGSYISEFYDGAATLAAARPVTVTGGAATTGIDGALSTGGTISGTVTDAGTGRPLGGISVYAETTGGTYLASATTDAQGRYTLRGLSAGNVVVYFAGNGLHESEYYDGATTPDTARPIAVTTQSATTGIDAALVSGAVVTGTVTAADTGLGLAGVSVYAYPASGGGLTGSATTDADGHYTIEGLGTGSYTVSFTPSSTQNYVRQNYPSAVSLTEDETTPGIDAALAVGGQITGTITDTATGRPLAGIDLFTSVWAGSSTAGYGYATTDASGHYTMIGLPTGAATVSATDDTGYHRTASTANQSVAVTAGRTTSGIDLALTPTGIISGSVTARDTGAAIANAEVTLYDARGAYVTSTETGSSGQYSFGQLTAGTYEVAFSAGYSGGDYGTIYYDGRSTMASADPVTVTAGRTTTGIDGALFGPPVNLLPPAISGRAQQGQVLTATSGSWTQRPEFYAYAWLRCTPGGSCSAISGATAQTYTLTLADAGDTVEVRQTATNAAGTSSPSTSAATATVLPLPPANVTLPSTSGRAQQGQTLTGGDGSWSNNPTSYARQWLRCDARGSACAAIGVATGTTYVPVAADVGSTLKYRVAATNAGGTSAASPSAATAIVVPPVPVAVTAPTITGSATQGQTLTERPGTWTNAPTSYGYQWERCSALGTSCLAIAGARDATYVPVAADVGATLAVAETATNAGGDSAPSTSVVTAVVAAAPPVLVSAPSISGTVQQGQVLTEGQGSWTNQPTGFRYQWQRCDGAGAHCASITGAAARTYTAAAADVGSTLVVLETATNAGGSSAPAASDPTAVVLPVVPATTGRPTITGTAGQGQTLTEHHPTWANAPTSYGYQWERCSAFGSSCLPIGGATDATYVPVADDVGATLAVTEVATNAGGDSAPVTSAVTAVVVSAPPALVSAPSISGTAQQGQALTEVQGSWTNQPTGFRYQWQRCDSAGAHCASISGATARTYTAAAADVGSTLVVLETATNAGGSSAPAASSPTPAVLPAAPTTGGRPTITGTAGQGQTLTEHHATWTGAPTSYRYQWARCDAAGRSCADLDGATDATYLPVTGDVGATLAVTEVATNAGGDSEPATSAVTAVVVAAPPAAVDAPTVTGIAQQGQALTEQHGGWTNEPASYRYQWERCDSAGAHCAPIGGATAQAYTPVAADVGATLVVLETATNGGGESAPAASASTAVVLRPVPTSSTAPAISGRPQQGELLTETHGTWTESPTSYAYQWERCTGAGTGCVPIPGATGQAYTAATDDIGAYLVVAETANNGGADSAAATSAPTAAITVPPLAAQAGEPIQATVGEPVTLDGSGSSPAGVISSYAWDFGDGGSGSGAAVQHTYARPGTYTARLTIGDAGHSAAATTTVTVSSPAAGAHVKVVDAGGQPVAGASLVYVGGGGSRVDGVTGADGVGTLASLPDGTDAVDVWKSGYEPTVVTVPVSGGTGTATATLQSGEVATTTLASHEMTLSEILAAGIDVDDPDNQQVFTFTIALHFPPAPGSTTETRDFCGYINKAGQFVGDTGFGACSGSGDGGSGGGGGGGGGGAGGPGCGIDSCSDGNVTATGTTVDGHPLIEWLILRGSVTTLKQFFSVSMVINNLSPEPFELTGGNATLDLPGGLSLAPTARPQSASQAVGTIPGGGSANATWVVRGDSPGEYGLTADYTGRLQPFDAPVDLSATLARPLHVWGAEALALLVQADSGSLAAGRPYHVRVGITNNADTPFYNVAIGIDPATHQQFLFQPGERFSDSVGEVDPGKTVYAHTYILVPDAASAGDFDPSTSFAHFDGQPIVPGKGISAVAPPPLYDLRAPTDTVGEVHLSWQPVPGAQGYEVYSIPDLDTPFADVADSVEDTGGSDVTRLSADATEAFIPAPADSHRWYAVSSIVDGHPTLEHALVVGVPGVPPPVTGGGGDDDGGGIVGGASGGSASTDDGLGAPAPTCANHSVTLSGKYTIEASCFVGAAGGVLQAHGRIRINGLDITSSGGFTVNPSALTLSASGTVDVYAGSLHLYHGELSWSLQAAKSFDVPEGLKIKGLPVSGSIDVTLTANSAEGVARAQIGDGDSPFAISGEIDLKATLASGLQLKSFSLTLDSDLPLKSLVVKQASLAYASTPAGDQWTGSVKVDLPKGPEVTAKLVLLNGAVAEVAINADRIQKPIGEVVFLQSLGLDVRIRPSLKATGTIGLTAGPKVDGIAAASLDGYVSAQIGTPFEIAAGGTLKVVDIEIASADLDAAIPGGVKVGGDMRRDFGIFDVDAHVGGSFDSRSFEVEGGIRASTFDAHGTGDVLADERGAAACANMTIDFPHKSFTLGAAHRWNGGNRELDGACGFTELRNTIAHAGAAGGSTTIAIPAARRQVNVIVHGQSGPPTVVLSHGTTSVTAAPNTRGTLAGEPYLALADAETGDTDVILPEPPAGSIGVGAAPGSGPVSVTATGALPSPNLHVRVAALSHRRYRLSWTAARIAGQTLTFRETSGSASALLGKTAKSKGSLVFTALDTPTAAHRIQAIIDQDGAPRQVVAAAARFAVRRSILAKPAVHVTQRHGTATITWSAVRGAATYQVAVTTADGRRLFFSRPKGVRSLRVPGSARMTVAVRGVSINLVQGPQRTVTSRSAK